MVSQPEDDGVLEQPARLQQVEHFTQLPVDLLLQVGVEVNIGELVRFARQRAKRAVHDGERLLLTARLGGKIFLHGWRQFDVAEQHLRRIVVLPVSRIGQHVMRVHQR